MITKFKIYESINDGEPDIGDYVIIETNDEEYKHYSNKYIGKIIEIERNKNPTPNFPNTKRDIFRILFEDFDTRRSDREIIWRYEIKYWSKNKEDLEPLIAAKKYNL